MNCTYIPTRAEQRRDDQFSYMLENIEWAIEHSFHWAVLDIVMDARWRLGDERALAVLRPLGGQFTMSVNNLAKEVALEKERVRRATTPCPDCGRMLDSCICCPF